jgi:hypothetical protein
MSKKLEDSKLEFKYGFISSLTLGCIFLIVWFIFK